MKLRILLAFAIGYVLGARAGRSRYDEIVRQLRELADSDLVRQLRTDVLGAQPEGPRTVTPPVIVGPGPEGGTAAARDVELPDVEPSTTAARAPGADPELRPAKRLDPPAV